MPENKNAMGDGDGLEKKRPKLRKGMLKRLLKMLFEFYPVMMPVVLVCIVFSAIVSSVPSLFMQNVIAEIEDHFAAGDWAGAKPDILRFVLILAGFYLISIISVLIYSQMMAIITQGFLHKLRSRMFNGMQNLPIKYFDTHNHGDIMSYYTNDTDTLRQVVSQTMPQLLISGISITTVFCIMLYFSIWMALLVVAGVVVMMLVTKTVGGKSAKFFVRQQKSIAKGEGFVEEMMNGQKVIKVFCHEDRSKADFDAINEQIYMDSMTANRYANILMPILGNIGNVLYVLVALFGGFLILKDVPNLSFSGIPMGISIVVPFLNMTKQFCGNIGQVSNQINSVVMALAGAQRIFDLIDEQPETDEGYVTLVNAEVAPDGTITESEKRTGVWAWKHPHQETGEVSYTLLRGDVRLNEVDFGYVENKIVLKDITIFAEPGQKVAFVGATGAGKTTITNLINRFYDIADGKIRYDGININKIKKADLRRSLGVVLQETNLFTGTVMENIRYGKLDATDEECIAAAKLAGADDFIDRLPQGYDTELSGNGANLSQGQRQLLAIARAAVADPPVMILDEATSSIDTRTEAIVQKGMDSLMEGRTVFVIAHRLSTVKNSDVIMVLDHGSIIERGSHDKLIAEKGTYYRLYTGAFELE